MPKFRKRPVVIEAVQWEGDDQGGWDVQSWIINNGGQASLTTGGIDPGVLNIRTLEGVMRANPRDWIIRGVKDEFYPCKPDIFEATYEAVPEPEVNHGPLPDGGFWAGFCSNPECNVLGCPGDCRENADKETTNDA